MFFSDSINYSVKDFDDRMFKTLSNIHITPYQYRTMYINQGDTIAKIIKRDGLNGRRAAILTNKKYSRKDTILLKEALNYFHIEDAYIYNYLPSKVYVMPDDLICTYSYHDGFSKQFFFWDEANDEDRFSIGEVHVLKIDDGKLFTKYRTNKYLTNKEILQIKQNKLSAKWKSVIYFYAPYENKKDYASIHYNETKKEYTIFMFNEKKTYTYNVSKKLGIVITIKTMHWKVKKIDFLFFCFLFYTEYSVKVSY